MVYAPGRGLRDYFGGRLICGRDACGRWGTLNPVSGGCPADSPGLSLRCGAGFFPGRGDRPGGPAVRPLADQGVRRAVCCGVGKAPLWGPAAGRFYGAYPAVLGVAIPELLPMVGFAHRNAHHCYDVDPHGGSGPCAPRLPCAWRCCCTTWSQIPFLCERTAGHFYGHFGGAWSWRK